MLMQELGRMIKDDPNLCAMTMVDKRKYIISKWNASHSEPIDEDAVALFLCDENRGNLTDDQRAFAKECCAEFEFCNQMTVYRLFQCGEMMRQHLVSGPAEYFRIFLPQWNPPLQRPVRRCVPSFGAGQAPAPPGAFNADLARFWARLRDGGHGGRGAGESPGAFVRPGSHNHPQCGRFRGFEVGAVSASRL